MRPPKPTPAELQLKRENDGLKTTIVCLRHDLTEKRAMPPSLNWRCTSARKESTNSMARSTN